MLAFEIVVSIPTAPGAVDYAVLVGLITANHPSLNPQLVEMVDGAFIDVHRTEEQGPPDPWNTGIRLHVSAADPLGAAIETLTRFERLMDAAKLRAHYPSIYALKPISFPCV